MLWKDKQAICPVGGEDLGPLLKNRVCAYICTDCGYIYTWDKTGELQKPVKITQHKDPKCGCKRCGR